MSNDPYERHRETVDAEDFDMLMADFDKANDRIVKLESSLLEFARHKSDCQKYGPDQCTCGFKQMIASSFADGPAGWTPLRNAISAYCESGAGTTPKVVFLFEELSDAQSAHKWAIASQSAKPGVE